MHSYLKYSTVSWEAEIRTSFGLLNYVWWKFSRPLVCLIEYPYSYFPNQSTDSPTADTLTLGQIKQKWHTHNAANREDTRLPSKQPVYEFHLPLLHVFFLFLFVRRCMDEPIGQMKKNWKKTNTELIANYILLVCADAVWLSPRISCRRLIIYTTCIHISYIYILCVSRNRCGVKK